MPQVDQNRLKGTYAAAYVAARLSEACLVRPVTADTDVGIDLYCETVEGTRPFLHFWVQVKAGAQCRLLDEGTAASCSFEGDHLEYWGRQPVPVFAALVPVEWPVIQDPAVHIVDVTRHLLENDSSTTHASQTLRSHHKWQVGNREDVRRFLTQHVRATAAILQCRNGVVTPIPSPEARYVRVVPPVPVARFRDEILTQIRWTASFAILSLRETGELGGAHSDFRRVLARVAAAFKDFQNWELYAAQAASSHADQEFDQAVEFYGKAIACIEGDTHVCVDPDWIHIANELKLKRQLAEHGEHL